MPERREDAMTTHALLETYQSALMGAQRKN